jgi:hypothetical protein
MSPLNRFKPVNLNSNSIATTKQKVTGILSNDSENEVQFEGMREIDPHFLGQSNVNYKNSQIGCRIVFESTNGDYLSSFNNEIHSIKQQGLSPDENKSLFKTLFIDYTTNYEIIQLFRHHSHAYNGRLTTGDGLCGYRALYQLYNRQIYQCQNSKTIKDYNDECNKRNPNLMKVSEREPFIDFLLDLSSKIETNTFSSQIHKVLQFIESEAKFSLDAFLPRATGGWMSGDLLPMCMQILQFAVPGTFLLAKNETNIFTHLGIVYGSSISPTTIPYLLNYNQALQILSGGYITFANDHFGVEPVNEYYMDIRDFENALIDVENKLFIHYFIN